MKHLDVTSNAGEIANEQVKIVKKANQLKTACKRLFFDLDQRKY
jgi:hypothetical protein